MKPKIFLIIVFVFLMARSILAQSVTPTNPHDFTRLRQGLLTDKDLDSLFNFEEGYLIDKEDKKFESTSFIYGVGVFYDYDAIYAMEEEGARNLKTQYFTSLMKEAKIGNRVYKSFEVQVFSLGKKGDKPTDLFFLEKAGKISIYSKVFQIQTNQEVIRDLVLDAAWFRGPRRDDGLMKKLCILFMGKLGIEYFIHKEGIEKLLPPSELGAKKKFLLMIADKPELAKKVEAGEKGYKWGEDTLKIINEYNAQ